MQKYIFPLAVFAMCLGACTKHIPQPESPQAEEPETRTATASENYLTGEFAATSFISYCAVDMVHSMDVVLDIGATDLSGMYPTASVTMYQETNGVTQTTKGYFIWEGDQLRWVIGGNTVGLYDNPNSENLAFASVNCDFEYSRISLVQISD